MVLSGAIVNGVGIVVGTTLGLVLHKIPEKVKETAMHGIGLAVILIGLQMAIQSQSIIVVLVSLLLGAVVGEGLNIEGKIERLGNWLESKTKSESNVSKGFMTSSLIFVIGAMSIVGALDSGIRGDHSVLFTKSILDGFVALILTTTLGIGVIFSVVPVVMYEGLIALFATQIDQFVSQSFLDMLIVELTATGGLLILAIGLNLLNIIKIRVANLLPSLLFVGFVLYGYLQFT
ncbi:membrane protein [Pontibacillus halophilus JSM 076056 = DSM 19796]|uniref:Membrane protein n=1 Tax=Pontibacillus halophilus JSM 076056 = DSM 19796 TaxID=1385510 RepID=A0A0A5GNY0_9BACI|nr:DUF554 domain-containing protein [Pontibacillus halophilus]KGX93684.1 membrane protein [Pontibacillus halophilus JSM 076056 = DSM 19796]